MRGCVRVLDVCVCPLRSSQVRQALARAGHRAVALRRDGCRGARGLRRRNWPHRRRRARAARPDPRQLLAPAAKPAYRPRNVALARPVRAALALPRPLRQPSHCPLAAGRPAAHYPEAWLACCSPSGRCWSAAHPAADAGPLLTHWTMRQASPPLANQPSTRPSSHLPCMAGPSPISGTSRRPSSACCCSRSVTRCVRARTCAR
jgi:hypothetical protein